MARKRSWRGWILAPFGFFVAVVAGIWLFMSFGGQAVHSSPESIPSVTNTAPPPEAMEAVERARRIVRAGITEQNLPGLSVAVAAGGKLMWAEGFGWADLAARAPVTPDTRFRIGTASTLLTSAAAGILLEKDRLKLDDEIQAYLPQFPKKQWPVTLRQLMAHTGGVGTDRGDESPLFRQRCERPAEAIQHFGSDALLFEPGTQYRHSKYGWILVSAAVEAAADRPFLTFMSERIFEPLGMSNTGTESATRENPERTGEAAEDAPLVTLVRQLFLQPLGMGGKKTAPATAPATVYVRGFGPDPVVRNGLHGLPPHNLSCYAGSMAFFSTPSDLARFGLAIHSGALLQPGTVQLLQTPHRLTSGQETGHGLGWDAGSTTLAGQATAMAGYDGELLGQKVASVLMFRDAGIVVAVTTNVASADLSDLARKVGETFARPVNR